MTATIAFQRRRTTPKRPRRARGLLPFRTELTPASALIEGSDSTNGRKAAMTLRSRLERHAHLRDAGERSVLLREVDHFERSGLRPGNSERNSPVPVPARRSDRARPDDPPLPVADV